MSLRLNPLNDQQLAALDQLTQGLTKEQTLWLSGFFEGRLSAFGGSVDVGASVNTVAPLVKPESLINLTILASL